MKIWTIHSHWEGRVAWKWRCKKSYSSFRHFVALIWILCKFISACLVFLLKMRFNETKYVQISLKDVQCAPPASPALALCSRIRPYSQGIEVIKCLPIFVLEHFLARQQPVITLLWCRCKHLDLIFCCKASSVLSNGRLATPPRSSSRPAVRQHCLDLTLLL